MQGNVAPVMGRPRKSGNRDLPANLYRTRDGFEYRHPVSGKRHYWGVPRERAIEAANKLNAILLPQRADLVGGVLGEGRTVADAIRLFRKEDVQERAWAPKTKLEHETRLKRVEADIGGQELAAFGVREAAEYLRTVTESPRARQQYRLLLVWIFNVAAQEGWIDQNPILLTKRPVATRKRARLTLEGFQRIRTAAPAWLQNAMDLALVTLQRRSDLARARFSDAHDGWLHFIPAKTAGSTGARIRVQVTAELEALIARCRDNVVSPYLVHRLPEKARPRDMRAKARGHHTQLLPEQISRGFDDARAACAAFDGVKNPPTFHEIRSLGADLYRQAGKPEAWIQQLLAHSEPAMTRHYLKGHEAPWTDVILV